MLVRRYNPNIRTSNVIIIVDTIIVGLNILFFREIEIGLYSAIAIYLMGIAEILGLDLGEEIEHKINKNAKRIYKNVNGVLIKEEK